MTQRYLRTDIWLLQAIVSGDRGSGASLRDIVATGDGLNHAIFNDEELESGFARLTAGGLIEERAGRFHPTAAARAHYEKARAGGGNVYEVRDALGETLDAERWMPETPVPDPRNNLTYPGFSSAAADEARRQWHDEAQKIIAGLDTGRKPKGK